MLASLSEKLTLGTRTAFRNLTLTPILATGGPIQSLPLKVLEEALADGTLKVGEVTEAGHVPELKVRNFGQTPVLILDGEELVGAKQNRMVNLTIVVPAWSEIVIPVSCVEAGRWSYRRRDFEAAGRVVNPKLRMNKAQAVTRNLKTHGNRAGDQGAVWADVDEILSAFGGVAPTRSFSDGVRDKADAINAYAAAFAPQPGQVGVVYRIDGALAGLEFFGCESTFARVFPKLVRGAALQAIVGYGGDGRADTEDGAFLRAALATPGVRFPAIGLGSEVRFQSDEAEGAALEIDDKIVHLFTFPPVRNAA